VIVSVGGRAVRSPAELRQALSGLRSGDIVTLGVYNAPSKTHRVERLRVN
jgi:S1-C subfamily serine protease